MADPVHKRFSLKGNSGARRSYPTATLVVGSL